MLSKNLTPLSVNYIIPFQKKNLMVTYIQADPAQALNVPVVPFGAIMAAAYPLTSEPPYFFSWITTQVSAPDMMHPEHFKKLVLTNFCELCMQLLFILSDNFGVISFCDFFSFLSFCMHGLCLSLTFDVMIDSQAQFLPSLCFS